VSDPDTEITLEKNLANLRNKGFVGELLKHGITDVCLAKKLKAELNAKKTKAQYDRLKGWTYSAPMTAWEIRQKARMDAQKLMGLYPPETTDSEEGRDSLNRLADALDGLRERNDD
jgi:hypothetical protein